MSAKLRALIRQLFGAEPMERYQDELLAYGDQAVGPLLEVFSDRANWDDRAPGGGVAPAKAARLLGRLRAPAAVEPLLEALEVLVPLEVLHDAVLFALADYGHLVTERVLAEAARARDEDPRLHESLVGVLAESGVRDPRIVDELRVVLDRRPGLAAAYLADYGDPSVLPDLVAALGRDLGTGARRTLHESELVNAIEALGGTPPARRGPPKRERPGRNARCWCGSGRKYKACHHDADRASDLAGQGRAGR